MGHQPGIAVSLRSSTTEREVLLHEMWVDRDGCIVAWPPLSLTHSEKDFPHRSRNVKYSEGFDGRTDGRTVDCGPTDGKRSLIRQGAADIMRRSGRVSLSRQFLPNFHQCILYCLSLGYITNYDKAFNLLNCVGSRCQDGSGKINACRSMRARARARERTSSTAKREGGGGEN